MPPPMALLAFAVTVLPLIVVRSIVQVAPPSSSRPPPSAPPTVGGPSAWFPLIVLSTIVIVPRSDDAMPPPLTKMVACVTTLSITRTRLRRSVPALFTSIAPPSTAEFSLSVESRRSTMLASSSRLSAPPRQLPLSQWLSVNVQPVAVSVPFRMLTDAPAPFVGMLPPRRVRSFSVRLPPPSMVRWRKALAAPLRSIVAPWPFTVIADVTMGSPFGPDVGALSTAVSVYVEPAASSMTSASPLLFAAVMAATSAAVSPAGIVNGADQTGAAASSEPTMSARMLASAHTGARAVNPSVPVTPLPHAEEKEQLLRPVEMAYADRWSGPGLAAGQLAGASGAAGWRHRRTRWCQGPAGESRSAGSTPGARRRERSASRAVPRSSAARVSTGTSGSRRRGSGRRATSPNHRYHRQPTTHPLPL